MGILHETLKERTLDSEEPKKKAARKQEVEEKLLNKWAV